MLQIISKRKIWFSVSGILAGLSVFFIIFLGLNFGIDFVGGSTMEVNFSQKVPAVSDIQEIFSDVELSSLTIQPTDQNGLILSFKETDEETHQEIMNALEGFDKEEYGSIEEMSFNSVGPSVGRTLKKKSFYAVILVIIAIILYIGWSFRQVSKPITSWKYGITAVITLIHDCLIVLGAFSIFGHFYGFEINAAFIAAILTVLGYSVNDTIVIFDRIRENLPKSEENFSNTINTSINQNITRSINTSLTTFFVLGSIFFFGGDSVKEFTGALLIGIMVGTYSSIFLASPLLVFWERK